MTPMLCLRKQHHQLHSRDDDHDDMGGLHRDLASTGSAIGRGDFLRYSLGAGALALFGCGGSLADIRSEEHTSELQSLRHLVCRLLLEKKKRYTSFRLYVHSTKYKLNRPL